MKTKRNPPTPRFTHMKAAHKKIKAIEHNIPQDIVQEILLRLPVKSLSRFKCASKPWCSLISSKSFIKAHLETSLKSPSLEHHWIIMDHCGRFKKLCSLPSFLQNPARTRLADLRNAPYRSGDMFTVVGSCNGLVCLLADFAEFILWNPTSRKCRNLDSIFNGTRRSHERVVAYGFGFDESNDEYKVFGVVSSCLGKEKQRKIYSSKTNSWRRIDDDAAISIKIFHSGKFVSGKLHWKTIVSSSTSSDIVTFDLEREVFGTAEWPSWDKYDRVPLSASVQVIGECLSCLVRDASYNRIDVWILMEYGVKDSWSLLATRILNPVGNGWTLLPARPNLLEPIFAGAANNGEEKLAYIYSCLYVYHRVRFSKPCLVNVDEFLEVTIYIESLMMI